MITTKRKGPSALTDETLDNDFLQNNLNKNDAFSKYEQYDDNSFRVSISEIGPTSTEAIFRILNALKKAGVQTEINYSSFDGAAPELGGLC